MGELVPFPDRKPAAPLAPLMFCAGCGADRTVPASAADPGPCPTCGSAIRSSCRPNGSYGVFGGVNGPVEIVFGPVSVGDIFGHPA